MTEPDGSREELTRRLDRIVAILQLAYRDQIDATRVEILRDPVFAAILELAATDWISAGELKTGVTASTSQANRTVERRLAKLVAMGVIEQQGTGARVRYRSAGII